MHCPHTHGTGQTQTTGLPLQRNGVASLFIDFEPLTGKRIVSRRQRLCTLFDRWLNITQTDSVGSG